jgi:two-component system, chemotaxis family, protein-glutamate methylesterase/glutaminase
MKTSGDADPATASKSKDIVAIGGSAGALDAMVAVVRGLPRGYLGSLFVVSHIGANPSQLPQLLAEAGQLPAVHPHHGEAVRPGHIYVAPPDRHLLVAAGRVLLSSKPREHFSRPAIDPLFRSAARAYGPRVLGIVLSGMGSDGALGLEEIRRGGGLAAVQDPAEAAFPEMPSAALHAVKADFIVKAGGIAELLVRLIGRPAVGEVAGEDPQMAMEMDLEEPFALTCPECGGAVAEIPTSGLITYRCHTGHRFSADELIVQQVGDIERAVMVAIRVLRERSALCRRMIGDAEAGGRRHGVAHWRRLKKEADDQLRVLQQFLSLPPSAESDIDYDPAGTAEHLE